MAAPLRLERQYLHEAGSWLCFGRCASGGSRGDPGPGGAGAVIVEIDSDLTHPKVVWSACLSLANDDTTNNVAEYRGVLAGLHAAAANQWTVDVVGDSSLILRQLRLYRPPRNARLRALYAAARRLADRVQVPVWQHHLRAANKMADAAANVAMDDAASYEVHYPSDRLHIARIEPTSLATSKNGFVKSLTNRTHLRNDRRLR